jgi:alkaline phosphatase
MKTSTPLPRFIIVFIFLLIFLSPILGFSVNVTSETPQDVAQVAAEEPLSIIFMIGDGMGYEHVELARLVEVGADGSLYMQQSTWNSSVTTHSADAAITDSAAAGTALATGNKTNNGMLGMLPNGTQLENIVEFAQTLNKSTGIVSTCRIVDATPAAYSTHVVSRNNRDTIAQQLVDNAGMDVLLSGGTDYFSSAQISTMVSNGYSVVYNLAEMNNVTSGKIFGLFAENYMNYEQYRNPTTEPSIAEMTNKSLELLSQDPDGFFLMVEGGKIDLAAHDENKVNNALDTIAFDKAVKIAIDYVGSNNNTILIVTADHETEGLVVLSHDLNSTLPASLTTEAEKKALRIARINNVTVDWTASYHTNWPVPVYCYGSVFSELPEDITIDNTEFFGLMKDYYTGVPLSVESVEPPVTATSSTTSSTTTTTTTLIAQPFDPLVVTVVVAGAVIGVIVIFMMLRKRS